MSEQDTGWKPSERMLKLAQMKGVQIPGVDATKIETTQTSPSENTSVPERIVEKEKKEKITEDLNLVIARVPDEVRGTKMNEKYAEYKEKVQEATERLKEQGIDVEAYTKAGGVVPGTKEGNDEIGKRKKELRSIVEKMRSGEDLGGEEEEVAAKINLKPELLTKEIKDIEAAVEVIEETKEEEPNQPKKRWEMELASIEATADPHDRHSRRLAWIQHNSGNAEIPFEAIEEQSNKLDIDLDSGKRRDTEERNIQNQIAAQEAAERRETKFTKEEEAKILQQCLNYVFIDGLTGVNNIKKALTEGEGWISLNLRPGENIYLGKSLMEKINDLDLGSWIDMRNTVSNWDEFKGKDEIIPSTITNKLFMDEDTEKFFATGKCLIPEVNRSNGKVELKEMDMGKEVGKAMKTLRLYFENTEYWGLVGGGLIQKEQLYSSLGLNRYVGEAAFSLLLSYQMLTETSADDYLSMMVQQDKARPKKYTKAASGDAYVRRMVQEDLVNKGRIFKDPNLKAADSAEMMKRLKKILPNQLIPTGLSNGGRDALMAGNWPEWRVENLYTAAQIGIDRAAGRVAKPANDNDSRLLMMRSALEILTAMKDVVDPSKKVEDVGKMTGKFYAHVNGSLRDSNWLVKDPNTGEEMVPAEMCFADANGNVEMMGARDWVSRNMLTVCETFLYTHSLVDHLNDKPMDMFAFARTVEEMFAIEAQADKALFVGMGSATRQGHRKELLAYADKLWSYATKISDALSTKLGIIPGNNPDNFPSWWSKGISASKEVAEAAGTVYPARGSWLNVKQRLEKAI